MRRLPLLLLLAACPSDDDPTDTDEVAPDPYDVQVGPYEAEIRTTAYGIPHITADDEGSLGFGLGYAAAPDHVCTFADQILKTRSERSKYFGPGTNDGNLDSDFGWLHLEVRAQAEETWFTLTEGMQARLVGYAAGYNRYLEEVGPEGLPEACRNQEWVKPIDHIDLFAYFYSLAQWGSGYALVTVIGQAQPPNQDSEGNLVPSVPLPPVEILDEVIEPPIGSNGWAIGRDESTTSGGLLLSNTHFPAEGERQWHEFHLTIPGELDVYGVGLVGLPMPAMGFNNDVAWTHTVSNTERFTPYLLSVTGAAGTSYKVDDVAEAMDSTTYTIEVKEGAGTTDVSRTLYRSRWGPIWNAPVIGWNGLRVMSYRDVNWKNTGLMHTFDGMNRAASLEEFQAAHRDHQGIPWVHTMMTDKDGNAFYTDSAAAPLISDEVWANYDAYYDDDYFVRQFADFGLTVFNGASSDFEWGSDDRAARPGTVPFDDAPQLVRADHVSNANENYWMANPAEPLEGLPRIYGGTGTPRTPRTRMNNFYLEGRGDDPERGEDGQWDLAELEAAALSFRSSSAELLLDGVVDRCDGVGEVTIDVNGTATAIDIQPACDVLAAWDGRGRTDSVGAHVWRELIGSGPWTPGMLLDAGKIFANGFDPNDPIGTPNGLAPAPDEGLDPIHEGLAIATYRLQRAGFDVDTPLGDIQVRKLDGETYPVPGGQYFEGYIGIATWSGGGNTTLLRRTTRGDVINNTTDLTTEGYVVTNGNSWMLALQFGDDGPDARAVMVYSQSEDPDSPHYADQTVLYGRHEMRDVAFTDAEISADPELVTETVSYP